jgi:hypothetical protein
MADDNTFAGCRLQGQLRACVADGHSTLTFAALCLRFADEQGRQHQGNQQQHHQNQSHHHSSFLKITSPMVVDRPGTPGAANTKDDQSAAFASWAQAINRRSM